MRFFIFVFTSLIMFSGCQKAKENLVSERKIEVAPTGATLRVVHPWDQWSEKFPTWVNPVEPFHLFGNVYYVGSEGLSSFLITSDAGHVLIDGTLPQNVPQIISNIETLGFEIEDIKILLNSHAHFDHSGGLKDLKDLTGARFIAHEGDRSALEGGFYLGAEFQNDYSAPRIDVDDVIQDGDVVKLGDIQLTANVTPGHSRGCTSWTMPVTQGGETFDTLFFCSATVAGNRLIPAQYEGIVQDYKTTFEKTRDWKPDVFLSNHPSFFNMKEKREKQKQGDAMAFVDRAGFPVMMKRLEADFEKKLKKAEVKQTNLQNRLATYAFDPTKTDVAAYYVFYSHGRIIEEQGVPAQSSRFGPYEYVDILDRFRQEGFTVVSEPRGPDADVSETAEATRAQIQTLLDAGVPASHVTVIGASKGAYITSLVSHELANADVNIVLLAGCSQGVVLKMIEADMKLYGNILTIRDVDDVEFSGSCASVLKTSAGVTDYQEIVTKENLSHGLIYTPHDAWVEPTLAWTNRE